MEIQGLSAIVTGGASGLGEATARRLAKAGAKVTIFDMNAERGPKIAADIGGHFENVDVSSADSVSNALEESAAHHGEARILINCAGIAIGEKTVGRDNIPHDLDRFKKVVEVNLIGTFNVIRLATARMAGLDPLDTKERGVVINTASVAAIEGQVGQVAYSASKGGIVGMTIPIARDLAGLGIRVCTIAPGLFLTPMMEGLPEEVQQSLGASVPFPNRLGRPDEYAHLVQHICENAMLNGEIIRLDGAIRMAPR
ncbi:MAG: 3-hydroxyacyl-CoA dehydrogenase [Alphaproteobacteria bacterium]|nr:MAG: 3-hydroxyacyl-CoA dehydrogenase [Alphaproteobacteria bacterium]